MGRQNMGVKNFYNAFLVYGFTKQDEIWQEEGIDA